MKSPLVKIGEQFVNVNKITRIFDVGAQNGKDTEVCIDDEYTNITIADTKPAEIIRSIETQLTTKESE